MARPMILIKEDLLQKLYLKHKDGVKFETLRQRHKLKMTGMTLKKLIQYYSVAQGADKSVSDLIKGSLFPEWLVEDVQKQDSSEWVYVGEMPLGHWKCIESRKN